MRTAIDRTMRGGSYRRERRRGYHESARPRARLGPASAIPAKPENVHEIGSTPRHRIGIPRVEGLGSPRQRIREPATVLADDGARRVRSGSAAIGGPG